MLRSTLFVLLAIGCQRAESESRRVDPQMEAVEAVVLEMNRAASAGELDAVLACFAKDSVQFQLEEAHFGFGTPELTVDLAQNWRSISPVLFGVAQSYTRTASELETRVDGKFATVWAKLDTATLMPNAEAPIQRSFYESYWLKRDGDTWQIMAIANSRGTSSTGGD